KRAYESISETGELVSHEAFHSEGGERRKAPRCVLKPIPATMEFGYLSDVFARYIAQCRCAGMPRFLDFRIVLGLPDPRKGSAQRVRDPPTSPRSRNCQGCCSQDPAR